MATGLLIIIYLAFISLGLPDSLLGSAWPAIQQEFEAPLGQAGIISVIISLGTIISSLSSAAVLKKFSTGKVTFVSVLMTAAAMLGFSLSPSVWWLLLFSVPLGLGGGSVDAGLNNYIAQHYEAHHMSWLHCFWGVGATLGPIIISRFIGSDGSSWRNGYLFISILQFGLTVVLLLSLPLWKKAERQKAASEDPEESDFDSVPEAANPLTIRGVPYSMLTFLFYCGAELSVGLWGSSFLVNMKHLSPEEGAGWVSLYYGGITVGRFLSGFISMKISSKMMIRIGQGIIFAGSLLLILPLPTAFSLLSFILIGLGCAPIFPSMIHETPRRFGKANSQKVIGLQMATAYTGNLLLPPLLGFISTQSSMIIFPFFVTACAAGMLLCSEKINLLLRQNRNG